MAVGQDFEGWRDLPDHGADVMPSPNTIVDRYWRCPWTFKANGDLHVHHKDKVIIIEEASYVPKEQRVKG